MSVASSTPVRILLVEDDPDIRETMTDLLEFANFSVIAAVSGQQAQVVLSTSTVDLIVTDAVMPNGDGYKLLDFIRTQDALRHLPVIMTSAKADKPDLRKGFAHGADEYLTKPYQMSELVDLVRALLAGRRDQRTLPREGAEESAAV